MVASFNWQREAEKQWDNQATFWSERSKNMWDNGSRKEIIPFIEKHLEKGSSILDIGCGDGYGTFRLHKSGFAAEGIDLSSEMINKAKNQFHDEGISFLQGSVMNLPFENESCDAIMAINVLEWTRFPAKAFEELDRVLKKGGLLCAGILGPTAGPRANSYPRVRGEEIICNTMMPWEFQKLALENGFSYVDGLGVYKEGVKEHHSKSLPLDLQQALTFMWVFMLRKGGINNG